MAVTEPRRHLTGLRRQPLPTAGGLVVGGDYQGLGIARSLGRRGVPVVVVDDELSIARSSRFVSRSLRVPRLRDPEETVTALLDTGRDLGLDGWVLFPTREETVAAIAQQRERLQQVFRVPTPSWETVRVAWDKRETYRVAERLGVPAPRCWFPRGEADLADVPLDAPVVLKPAVKEHFFYATGVKAWRADTREQLYDAFRRATEVVPAEEVIVQEMIPGDGTRQSAYCAFFRDGEAVATMTVLRRRQHPSDFGRASTYVETVDLPEIVEPAERFLREIGYYGLVEMEFKHDPRDGRPKLLDVNARTWGYHSLGAAAGVDFPALLHRDQLGLPVRPVHARPGVRWVRLATDLPNAVRDVRRGALRAADYARSLRGVDVDAVWASDDPLPMLMELGLLPYLAVRRGL
jgi:predicted ATP-grasp superfamily ATP-dependent carboligase